MKRRSAPHSPRAGDGPAKRTRTNDDVVVRLEENLYELRDSITSQNQRIERKNAKLERDNAQFIQELKAKEKELQLAEGKVSELQSQMELYQNIIETLCNERQHQNAQAEQPSTTCEDNERLAMAIEDNLVTRATYRTIKYENKHLHQMKKRFETKIQILEQELTASRSAKAAQEAKDVADLARQKTQLSEANERLSAKVVDLKKEITKLKKADNKSSSAQIQKLHLQIKDLKNTIKKMESERVPTPVLERDAQRTLDKGILLKKIADIKAKVITLKEERYGDTVKIAEQNALLNQWKQKCAGLEAKISASKSRPSTRTPRRSTKMRLKDEIDTHKATISTLQDELKLWKQKCADLEAAKTEHKEKNESVYMARVQELESTIEKLNQQLASDRIVYTAATRKQIKDRVRAALKLWSLPKQKRILRKDLPPIEKIPDLKNYLAKWLPPKSLRQEKEVDHEEISRQLKQLKAGVQHQEYKREVLKHGVVRILVHLLYKEFMEEHYPDILDVLLTLVRADGKGDPIVIEQVANAEGIRILMKLYINHPPDTSELDKTLELMTWVMTDITHHPRFVYDGLLSRLDELGGHYNAENDPHQCPFREKAQAILQALTEEKTVIRKIYEREITVSEE
jgi:chromosome segregation ATPase